MQKLESINEFVIRFANVNGTGSWSANLLFAKAVFRSGIPVSAKNIFPSNIQGLPTWYEVRASEKGYIGNRAGGVDIMVSTNPESIKQDIASLVEGGFFVHDCAKVLSDEVKRDDINYIELPLTDICTQEYDDPRLKLLFKNIIYVGAVAALVDISFDVLEGLVKDQFANKEKLIEPNINALKLGYKYAKENYSCPIGIKVKKANKTNNKILIDGNKALGLGAVYGGATVCGWYPITPSTSVVDNFKKYCKELRVDNKTGKNNFAILQVEDELAAIGTVIGAAWNGARSFTATSGAGISLMTEFLGLAYFAEIPTVIYNVQRVGPSTGMPTRTQQADIISCVYASQGDTKNVLLFPCDPKEAFEMGAGAFDIAERLQMPVIVMSDLDLGMNDNMCDPLEWDNKKPYDHGKVLTAEDLEKLDGEFGRYKEVDGDGIAYRTIPGTHPTKGAFFTRGTSHTEYAKYTENSDEYIKCMERLSLKWKTAERYVPEPVIERGSESKYKKAVIYFGTSQHAAREALDMLAVEDYNFDAMRLRAVPFNKGVGDFIEAHDEIYVIEQNRDGQMRTVLINELEIDPKKMKKVLIYDGMPITALEIYKQIKEQLGKGE